MTNSYDVDHGLSQCPPGPLEPVELPQQDDTLARTGNTARDQEMYAASRAVGEENAKHNAAIRAGVPDGWKLVTKKTCYTLMHDGAVIATLAGPESEANAAIIARMLAAPGVSTVEAHPVAWMDPQTLDVISAERKASWLNEYGAGGAAKAATYTRALGDLRPAPAAGDALTESVPEWAMCESRGPWARNSLMAAIHLLREKETRARHAFTKDYMGLPARYIADAYGEAAAVVERKLGAIAAQRKGDA